MLKTALFDCAINEKCCSVDGGRGICPLFSSPPPGIYHSRQKKKKIRWKVLLTVISPCSVQEQGVFRNSAKIEVPGILDKVLYGEALPLGPSPYPFNIPFVTEKVLLRIPFLGNGTPFTYLVQNFASLLTAVPALSLKYE